MAINPASLEACLTSAADAGVPRDQITNFLTAGYVPLPWSMKFHAAAREADSAGGPVMIACGGARGPGKSHSIMAQVGLDDCQRAPGLKFLFLRKVKRVASESFDDLIRKVFYGVRCEVTAGRVMFENQSRMLIGGYRHADDIDQYLGIEYDGIVLEEGNQISGDNRDRVRGSLRTSRSDWRARWYESSNPGGIGHTDFKNLYVIPQRTGKETNTRFFPSTYKDNPFLSPEYIEYLESLPGALGEAWRGGNWDVFEGQVFSEWNYDLHTIPPMQPPSHWRRIGGCDWGYDAPFSFYAAAQDPDTGRVIIYKEIYDRGLTDREQARSIKRIAPECRAIYADPNSYWVKKNYEDRTFSSSDEYAVEGVPLAKADNTRLTGLRKMHTMLSERASDGLPLLQFTRNCTNIIRTLPALPHDETNPEDVDTDAEDHAYDGVRYLLTPINPRPVAKSTEYKPPHIDRLTRLSHGGNRGLRTNDL